MIDAFALRASAAGQARGRTARCPRGWGVRSQALLRRVGGRGFRHRLWWSRRQARRSHGWCAVRRPSGDLRHIEVCPQSTESRGHGRTPPGLNSRSDSPPPRPYDPLGPPARGAAGGESDGIGPQPTGRGPDDRLRRLGLDVPGDPRRRRADPADRRDGPALPGRRGRPAGRVWAPRGPARAAGDPRQLLGPPCSGCCCLCWATAWSPWPRAVGATSGYAALLVATVPLLVIVYRLLDRDRPRPLTVLGVLVGFAGLAVLVTSAAAERSTRSPWARRCWC